MGLQRDIYWLRRQWAVTGHGIQAVDQKRFGQYDVGATRIGNDEVIAELQAFDWFDIADFREALRHVGRRPPSGLVPGPCDSGGEK